MKTDVAIPGLTLRSYKAGDAEPLSRLYNRGHEVDGVEWRTDAAELENFFGQGTEMFQPARDLFIAEVDGTIVGSADVGWIDTNDDLREYRVGCAVDPDWRRRGLGRWLQARNEQHARELAALYPSDRPQVLGAWAADTAVGTIELLRQSGFEPVRYFFDMVRPSLADIVEPSLPDSLEFRPVEPGQLRQLWDADVEAFKDHWGGFDGSDTRFEQWKTDPKFDPALLVVAWDGDQIAGGSINEISEAENAAFNRKQGWLASVFVRRPWRKRGLGTAVVLRSLQVLRDAGMTSAGLGVDAANPTGALGLYERTGFEVHIRSTAYRKPMPLE